MERFYKMAEAADKRFPEGVEPFQMLARLLEECGEVAKEVNHFEGSGIKLQKYGAPSKEKLANEIRQAAVALFQLAKHYSVENELEQAIEASLQRSRAEGLIE